MEKGSTAEILQCETAEIMHAAAGEVLKVALRAKNALLASGLITRLMGKSHLNGVAPAAFAILRKMPSGSATPKAAMASARAWVSATA